jgi:predicted regulator of amino acid metabolism with ACT domain
MPIRLAISQQLVELGRSLEELGESLCADPELVASHMTALQEIDRIAQMQFAIAAIIAASDAEAACLRSPLERIRTLAPLPAVAA